ncbi:thermonuclease family protein [Effusibacillus pohliae]|uniref:thermonuclease family protein n=1 Tax=Effusibacillus pohliae TaxID=232270 RepID=UPI0003821A69|nr:thermonuclease family protein [Effusibacillus pohliae]
MKKLYIAIVSIALLAGCTAPKDNAAPANQTKVATETKQPAAQQPTASVNIKGRWATVTHVADGDTVEVEGGEKVRLIGVNTPESVKPGVEPMPMGKEASDFTKSQLQGKKVFVETDVQPKDKYGRTLAYLYLQEPKTQEDVEKYMYNAILLKEGYAQLMTIPPNVKYVDLFTKLQMQAREAKKGIWSLGIYKDEVKNTNDVFLDGKTPKK